MQEILQVRLAALLHDIGKPECWANQKPWSHHIYYTEKLLNETVGAEVASIAMRHHSGSSYNLEDRPKTDIERIICLADNIASGADRPEETMGAGGRPSLPVRLTHILSDGSKIVKETTARDLYLFQEQFKQRFKGCLPTDKLYDSLYDFLSKSLLREIPADTRSPVNDASLWDHLKLTAAIANCAWKSGGYQGDEPSKYKFVLISADADRVSDYINASSRLPDLEAGSRKVKEATEEAAKTVKEILGPECLLFHGGGSLLVISPPNESQRVLREVKNRFETSTRGMLTMTVCSTETDGGKIKQYFGSVWEEAVNNLRAEKGERAMPIPPVIEENIPLCDVCRKMPAEHFDDKKVIPIDASPRPEALCSLCWEKRMTGKGVSLDDMKDGRNFVAVIKADGDGLGEVLSGRRVKLYRKAMTPSRLSTISGLLHQTCEITLVKEINSLGGEAIFAGGDDILAVTPGMKSLHAARAIASKFEEALGGEATLSAGVAIFHYRLPIYVALESATILLRKAKQVAGKASIAFHFITEAGVLEAELEKCRAYSWVEIGKLLRVVDYLRRCKLTSSQVRLIAAACKRNRENAQTVTKYFMGRGQIEWHEGERLLAYIKSGLFHDAFQVYNAFRGGEEV
ncbi:MAG: type III-B CRISPR-associated protein Cas10/Cmr2 [Candidatus Bathyarchaeia archaeon]